MTDILSVKEVIKRATHGNEKMQISIPIAFGIDMLIRNENITSKKTKQNIF